jgi:SpoVK/Ycf46/Vps4 family AAA+-type ATPase
MIPQTLSAFDIHPYWITYSQSIRNCVLQAMVKKKKNKSTPSKSPIKNEENVHDEPPSVRPSAIIVSLADTTSIKIPSRSLTEENRRVILIKQDDLDVINVCKGEEVLVVEVESSTESKVVRSTVSQEPRFIAICKIDTVSQNNDKKHSTQLSPKATPSKGMTVSRILPNFLAKKLFQLESDVVVPILQDDEKTPFKTPKSTTAQFTFESFVTSPESSSKSSSKMKTPQQSSRTNKNLAIVSLKHCPELYKLITVIPIEVSFRVVDINDTYEKFFKAMKNGSQIIGHMIKGLCRGQYLSIGDIVTVSFQGKKIQLELSGVIEKQKHEDASIDDLVEKMEDTKIESSENTEDPNDLLESLVHQLSIENIPQKLYLISYESKIMVDIGPKQIDDKRSDNVDEKQSEQLVAGLESVMSEIRSSLIPILHHPENFPQSGPIRAPKGLLLHGPSGCGKSLIAIQLAQELCKKNIHGDSVREVETTFVDCANIQSATSIMGEAERQLTKVFEKAEKIAVEDGVSSLIVLDDVHLICPRRGAAGETSGVERVASTLLALMDGVSPSYKEETNHKIPGTLVILAITHNPSLLDPALRRAGRIDLEVAVPIPDEKAKAAILELCIKNMCHHTSTPFMTDIELLSLAKKAKGFTGADCVLSIKEAMRRAIQRQCKDGVSTFQLTLTDLEHATRTVKPSAIKSITVEIPHVPWSSIGGMDDVKKALQEAIELPISHSHLFSTLKISPPRGVLLYGPPGCSKTLMARALATESNMNFLAVKGPELLSKWLGESERALAALFRRARLASPCVIFFDEIDAIAASRGSGEGAGGERLLSQLLTELDGVKMTGSTKVANDGANSQIRVVVVGATNRPDLLDKALTRPGRIDRMIYVGLPDIDSRRDIFQLRLTGIATSEIDFDRLAHISDGFSGAEIVSICREASLFAIEECDEGASDVDPIVTMENILRSLKGTKRQITPEMLRFYENFRQSNSV